MPLDSSITLDIETAVTVGSWLQRMSQQESLEPAIAEPVADLAAAIGDRVREQEVSEDAPLELSVTTAAPSDSPSHSDEEDRSPSTDEYENLEGGRSDEDSLSEQSATPPSQVYDDLPAHAWDASPVQGDVSSDRDRAESDDCHSSSAAEPGREVWESGRTPPLKFVTAYECEVCGSLQERETSVKVCAYVADCPVCTAADARFTAIEIPTLLSEDPHSG
ncbi:hypothetical protein [Saliphagus sp. LR7]|uniref:hypothetical protein n=1 Tax=Saliphagus sp. LR7 TaxID=2282654 RepID=UPI000DF78479|nr:hypothetical protein [Saliphagus sp. LR7]